MALNATHNAKLESPQYLLESLVRTVQFLLDISTYKQSVFHVVNGLNLLHFHVKRILKHGAKTYHYSIYSQSSYADFDTWLEKTLLSHSLLNELCKESVSKLRTHYYHEWAFLRSEQLYQYFLNCLYSLATRNFNVLSNIPSYKFGYRLPITFEFPLNGPVLFSVTSNSNKPMPNHKQRLNSVIMSHSESARRTTTTTPRAVPNRANRPTLESVNESDQGNNEDVTESPRHIPEFSYSYGSPVVSVPIFSQLEDQPTIDPMFACFRTKEDFDLESQNDSVSLIADEGAGFQEKLSIASPRPSISSRYHPLPSPVPPTPKSFLESGGFVQPLCTAPLGHFPLPYKGQSLTSFLTSLSDTSQPELDRENAHFNVSEALISAFETMKVRQKMEQLQEQRRKDRIDAMFGEVRKTSPNPEHSGVMKKRLLLRGHGLRLRQPQRQESHVGFTTEESENEFRKQSRHPPSQIKRKPKALEKLGSDGRSEGLFSTTEVSSGTQSMSSSSEDIDSSSFSAEKVGLNLLRNANMEERHLPQASELQWIVTDRDTPQSLLPLPKNWNSTAESDDSLDNSMRLRGNSVWAPPRSQIIFTIHPTPALHVAMEAQKYLCAGCGMRVEKKYASTFRYCNYLGKFFCTGCHTLKRARLPQMILNRWDFSTYYVSNFSATLLESLQNDPVYNLMAINPSLSRKGRVAEFRNLRIQFRYVMEYLQNCKTGSELYAECLTMPKHYVSEVDLYCIEDLVQLRYGAGLPLKLKEIVSCSVNHILHCQLCKELGFLCELCKSFEVIFPFQTNRVSRCHECKTCFHLRCFNPSIQRDCPKCLRLLARRLSVNNCNASSGFITELPV